MVAAELVLRDKERIVTKVLLERYKSVPVLNSLNTVPSSHIGEWRYSSTILDLGTRCM
jgi:hypothetical protein